MFLDINNQHKNYNKDIIPFIKNGIIIDTSVIKILIDGLISTRFSKKKMQEYDNLLNFFDIIKVNNKWDKFLITPHILTETCRHFHIQYNKNANYAEVAKEILPILDGMNEKLITKKEIIDLIDKNKPIIELGDISIFAITQDIINSKCKIAILVKDDRIAKKYANDQNVMIMDFNYIINDMTLNRRQ